MQCTYINLKARDDKRALIETSFNENKIDGWSLKRFEAIDKDYVEVNKIPGTLPSGEKGCFLSHKQIIKNSLNSSSNLFIVEDDVVFGKSTFATIDSVMSSIPYEWDILFLDICVPVVEGMMQLFWMRKELKAEGAVTLLNLSDKVFASAASYIVNINSIKKYQIF